MITRTGTAVHEWVSRLDPWGNVYGVARTLMGFSTALTLFFNPTYVLFVDTAAVTPAPYCGAGFQRLSLFCLVPASELEIARWIGFTVCVLVLSGWRPRITGVMHWWVAHSLFVSASTVDGGDQAAAVLALLLLPATLTDDRKWHWASREVMGSPSERELLKRAIAVATMLTIRLQVAVIYLHAAAGKMAVPEWADGTAMYYWLLHPIFGANPALRPALLPFLLNPFSVAGITWGVIIVEFLLLMGLFATRKVKAILLPLGIALHLGILVLQGLVSFSTVMIAALIMYLRPWDDQFRPLNHAWALLCRVGWRNPAVQTDCRTAPI